jgi:hypothetical protein
MIAGLPKIRWIELEPTREKSALLIRLTFRSTRSRHSPIEFELSSEDAMRLLAGLQLVQRQSGWTVPFFGRGKSPNLRIVKDDSD